MKTRKNSFMLWGAKALAPVLLLAGVGSLAQGGVILSVTGGGFYDNVGSDQVGQSFTTPGGGAWDNITFNFFSDVPALTPLAAGNAFLLTQEYLGTPAGLSSSTPGFLAESTGLMAVNSGNVWVFDPSVVLNPNTEYWIYEDASIITTGASTGGIPGVQETYFTHDTGSYSLCVNDCAGDPLANFELDGTVAPEPGAWLMGLTGFGVIGLVSILRRRSAARNHAQV